MAWRVFRFVEAHAELLDLLSGQQARAYQNVKDQHNKLERVDARTRQLGKIEDLPFSLVYPRGDPRNERYALARLQMPDEALDPEELCLFIAFANQEETLGVLGYAWWDDHEAWLSNPLNQIQRNPTYAAYLERRRISNRRTVLQRYNLFRKKFGD